MQSAVHSMFLKLQCVKRFIFQFTRQVSNKDGEERIK